MNRLCQQLAVWAGALGLTACAATGPLDPSEDRGFFHSLQGASGGYQQTIEGKKGELAAEEEQGRQLKEQQGELGKELDKTSATLAAMRQDIRSLDAQIASLQSRTRGLTKRSSGRQTELANLQTRLAQVRSRSRRLETDASVETKKAKRRLPMSCAPCKTRLRSWKPCLIRFPSSNTSDRI